MPQRARVGVRELRQNLSVYLRRVKAGEALQVTERGVPVAELRPLAEEGSRAALIAGDRLVPARSGLADLGPPPGRGARIPLSDALDEVRKDRL